MYTKYSKPLTTIIEQIERRLQDFTGEDNQKNILMTIKKKLHHTVTINILKFLSLTFLNNGFIVQTFISNSINEKIK